MRSRLIRPLALCLVMFCALPALAQEGGEPEGGRGGGMFAGMQRVSGVVTAVSADKLTLKAEDGATYQVVTTPNTRLMRNGATFKLTDLKPGDGVMSAGNLDAPNKTLHAAMVISIDAEQVKKMAAARDQFMASLGKTVIAGRVTAVDLDNAKITLERPDHVSQTISVDESTSFRRGAPGRMGQGEANGMGFGGAYAGMRGNQPAAAPSDAGESITLADVKVGDNVNGSGSVKNGAFVPKQLVVRTPRPRGERRREGQTPGGASAGSATKPPSN